MYKAIKDNKIIAISNEQTDFPFLVKDEVIEDILHTVDDYGVYYYNDKCAEYLLKSEIPAPTHDKQSEKRAQAYRAEVDPITSHIQRLRDIDPVPQEEIDELIAERDAKVQEIKERYPYPEQEPRETPQPKE